MIPGRFGLKPPTRSSIFPLFFRTQLDSPSVTAVPSEQGRSVCHGRLDMFGYLELHSCRIEGCARCKLIIQHPAVDDMSFRFPVHIPSTAGLDLFKILSPDARCGSLTSSCGNCSSAWCVPWSLQPALWVQKSVAEEGWIPLKCHRHIC